MSYYDEDDECPEGYISEQEASKNEDEHFRLGAAAMREMLARFVEQGGNPEIAQSMRLNWSPSWGEDPGPPADIDEAAIAERMVAHAISLLTKSEAT